MSSNVRRYAVLATIVAAGFTVLLIASMAAAAPELNTFVISSHFGWKVDGITDGDVCTTASTHECRKGEESEEPGGFAFPESVAVAKNGNLYIADKVNRRIQEIDPEGKFVLMFGWNVNKTKVVASAPQAERNVCTAVSKDECQAGEGWTEERNKKEVLTGLPGQLYGGQDVAVDQGTNNVYVLNYHYHRIDEYTASGEFVLMFGGQVNRTKVEEGAGEEAENVCTAVSGDVCQSGVESEPGSRAHGAIKPESAGAGSLLAVGGQQDLLYVGDEGRVQKFDATGKWRGEVSLAELSPAGKVGALAVDPSSDVFVAFTPSAGVPGIYEYNQADVLQAKVIDPGGATISALAWDPHERLGVVELEAKLFPPAVYHGYLYSPAGEKISEFDPLSGEISGSPTGLGIDTTGRLYVANASAQEIEAYALGLYPGARTCPAESVGATSATLCAEINPNGLMTVGSFTYSPPAGSQTPVVFEGAGETFSQLHWQLVGLVPNETYKYNVVASAEFNGKKEVAVGENMELRTTLLPPVISGEPRASFVKDQSAVLSSLLNPEHDSTRYHFEYGKCEKLSECSNIQSTEEERSAQYGVIGVAQEVKGLTAHSRYSYRLVATNDAGGASPGNEGSFETKDLSLVGATTGSAGMISNTGAVISGTVDPDGRPAIYRFELGVFQGEATRYGVVSAGQVPPSTGPVPETFEVTGLQAGMRYAYRIMIVSGYGEALGMPTTFTTEGLSSVLVVPTPIEMLATPPVVFPRAAPTEKPRCKRGYKRNRRRKCVKVRKKVKTRTKK